MNRVRGRVALRRRRRGSTLFRPALLLLFGRLNSEMEMGSATSVDGATLMSSFARPTTSSAVGVVYIWMPMLVSSAATIRTHKRISKGEKRGTKKAQERATKLFPMHRRSNFR